MGLGLAMLAGSRPYEGFVLSLPVAVALVAWLVKKRTAELKLAVRQVALPLGLMLLTTGAAIGYYNWRVTGRPFRMPYQEYDEAYKVSRYFVWQSPRPIPVYHHEVMRKFLVDIQPTMDRQFQSPGTAVLWMAIRTFKLWIDRKSTRLNSSYSHIS